MVGASAKDADFLPFISSDTLPFATLERAVYETTKNPSHSNMVKRGFL
jgi:hypothetical protein